MKKTTIGILILFGSLTLRSEKVEAATSVKLRAGGTCFTPTNTSGIRDGHKFGANQVCCHDYTQVAYPYLDGSATCITFQAPYRNFLSLRIDNPNPHGVVSYNEYTSAVLNNPDVVVKKTSIGTINAKRTIGYRPETAATENLPWACSVDKNSGENVLFDPDCVYEKSPVTTMGNFNTQYQLTPNPGSDGGLSNDGLLFKEFFERYQLALSINSNAQAVIQLSCEDPIQGTHNVVTGGWIIANVVGYGRCTIHSTYLRY